MSSDTTLVRFTAKCNGKKRGATVRIQRIYKDDVEEAQVLMENDETAYREFYRGATEEDFEATLTDQKVRAYR